MTTEEELRLNPTYCEMMDYYTGKMMDTERRYGPILGKSPVSMVIESFKRLDESLLKLRKEIDKDKKVVNISDYRI